ncbi:MAG: peptidylprolyl isomerase [Muribaculaceae bacterium]|nr:peptidylprolyl isomerase [Muribaculaceae bacterium]
MKKQFFTAAAISATLLAITAQKPDPVLMTVNGKDVKLSEFEYLYNKNNAQQVEPQTIDQYVDMFIDYKLKVADAEAHGLDTTEAFVKEYAQFTNELSAPYLIDREALDSLVRQQYSHMERELLVSHIMVNDSRAEFLDSIRTEILNGNITFEDAAREYSIDKPSAVRGGLMGMVLPGQYPWAFEEASYATAPGAISPVINSGFGNHIIRVEKSTPARGEVRAAHILRTTRGLSDSAAMVQKQLIDSIYAVVKADPDKFTAMAEEFSEDPGSAKRGGDLDWFRSGAMVAEFDSVAFAIPVGSISEPFTTAFGWHIIKKNDARGIGTLEENRTKIEQTLTATERGAQPRISFINKIAKAHNGRVLTENIKNLPGVGQSATVRLDSALIAEFAKSDIPLVVIEDKVFTLGDIAKRMRPGHLRGYQSVETQVTRDARALLTEKATDIAREDLMKTNPDYANLINEYRDGILLFEISNTNVWDKASKDKDGLEKFFKANRKKYAWDTPKFKSYVIFAPTDSLLSEAMNYASTLSPDIQKEQLVDLMREKFGRDIKVEKVIAAKGDNKITDYLAFGGPRPEADNARWSSYAALFGRIIPAPEEAADVRGAAVADYQAKLEQEWLRQLHKRYKVQLNKDVLKLAR